MSYILNKNGKIIVVNLIKTIQANKDYLSEIDGAIGDGDHGINMNKGFSICEERITGKEINLTEGLKTLAMILMMEIGGSMGPLYGTLFLEMSKVTEGKEVIDSSAFAEMLDAALNGINQLSNAKVGDKTLLDTLVPAVNSFKNAVNENKSFAEALKIMKDSAEKGKESTINLVAKVGRASRLGERSIGVLDAGATSCYLILASITDSIINLL